MSVELVLQLLVGVIDHQLFERILFKDLKAEYIKDTDELLIVFLALALKLWGIFDIDGLIDSLNQPRKQFLIYQLGNAISSDDCILGLQINDHSLVHDNVYFGAEEVLDFFFVF